MSCVLHSTKQRVNLSAPEWCLMKEFVQILQTLEEEATWELSTKQRVSCSKVIPLLNAILFELCKNVIDDDKTQVLEKMRPRCQRARETVFLVLKTHSK